MIVMVIHMVIVMDSRMAFFEFRSNSAVCFLIWLEHQSPVLAAENCIVEPFSLNLRFQYFRSNCVLVMRRSS